MTQSAVLYLKEHKVDLLNLVLTFVCKESDPDNLFRGLMALGTLLKNDERMISSLRMMDGQFKVGGLDCNGENAILVQQILEMLQ